MDKRRVIIPLLRRVIKQIAAISNFEKLIQKSSLKKKAREYDETRQEAVPLIKRRFFNSELRDIEKEMDVFLETETQLRSREAELRPFVKKHSALQIQSAMRNKIARNTVKQTRITKNTAATKIQKTIRETSITGNLSIFQCVF